MSKTIRILGKKIEIIFVEDSPLVERSGEMHYLNGIIYIRKSLYPDEQKETLLHEVIHCIDYQLKLDLSEAQVHRLAVGLYAVMADNWNGIPDIENEVIPSKEEIK